MKKWAFPALLAGYAACWTGCTPPGPRALLEGERLILAGRPAEAIPRLKEATLLLPRNPQAWNHLGLANHHAKQYNAAVQSYRRALELDYNLAPAQFNLGNLLLEINQPQLAANAFAAYTVLKPDAPDGWVLRGRAEWYARQFDAAESSLRNALRLDPKQPEVWNSLGVLQLYRRNYTEAHQAFSEALNQRHDYAPATYNVALVSHFYLPRKPVDHRPFALQKYREYVSLQPPPPYVDLIAEIAANLDRELNPRSEPVRPAIPVTVPRVEAPAPPVVTPTPPKKRPEPGPAPKAVVTNVPRPEPKAEPAARPVMEPARPAVPEVVPPVRTEPRPMVQVARVEPRPAPVVEVVKPPPPVAPPAAVTPPNPPPAAPVAPATVATTTPAVPRFPSFAAVGPNYRGLNYSYLNPPPPSAGFRHKAMPHFEEAQRTERRGQWDEAITAYRRAIQWDGAFFEAYHNLGLAATQAGDFLRAAVAFETALALRPNSDVTRYNFALLLNGRSYYRDAAIELEKLLFQNPDDARSHLLLGNLYAQRLGQPDRARPHYLRVLELAPSHPQGTSLRYWLRLN